MFSSCVSEPCKSSLLYQLSSRWLSWPMPLLRAGVSIQTMHKLRSAINLFRLQLFSSAFLYPTRQTGLGSTGKKHFYGQRGSKTAIHLGDQGPAPIAKKADVKVPYWADPGALMMSVLYNPSLPLQWSCCSHCSYSSSSAGTLPVLSAWYVRAGFSARGRVC